MHPDFFRIGPLTIHAYGVMMALGFLAGLTNWYYLGRREGRDIKFCSDLLFVMMMAGVLGGRVAYVIADFDYFRDQPLKVFRIDEGGLIYYGGFLGALVAVWVLARMHRESFLKLGDFVITSLPLAHAFGRIGCFLNGCCFGREWSGALAVCFPAGSLAWHQQVASGQLAPQSAAALPVHPPQLYESAFNLALYVVILCAYRRRRHDGAVAGLYLLLYPAGRFALEFLRGDDRLRWMHLSVAQWISLALFVFGAGLLAATVRRPPRPVGAHASDRTIQ